MARHSAVVVALVVASALCLSSAFARVAPAVETFSVEGKVYCDPCRLEFETRLSHPLSAMDVTLQCRHADSNNITYEVKGKTDANGYYSLAVSGDHEDEICELKTEKSAHAKCKEPMANRDSDRIVLTRNMGATSGKRLVNPLGFMTHGIDARCIGIVKELGLDDPDFLH